MSARKSRRSARATRRRKALPNESSGGGRPRQENRAEGFFANLGPGIITGCADDDPSGISTYSVAGASFGYGLLWTALVSFPLMSAVQLMCGRLGMVTGRGLAGVIRRRYSRWVLWVACGLLLGANIINIGADLGGMGAVTQMLTGIHAAVWTPLFTAIIIAFLFWSSYRQIARFFKWITLVLLAYVGAAIMAHVDWRHALIASVWPRLNWSKESLAVLVGILGTTISPYLFFWQTSLEVEEERAQGKNLAQRQGATPEELRGLRFDVILGMFLSNFIMYFIIVTTAATLNAHGIEHIGTASQAAQALTPFAGRWAALLFSVGLIGTGMLGVPVLAGSCAYAIAEAAGWYGSLDKKPRGAKRFYAVLAVALVLGLAMNLARVDPIQMLFWAAVINGALAPPLILIVVLLTSDKRVMGEHVNSPILRILGWVTFLLLTAATIGMLAR